VALSERGWPKKRRRFSAHAASQPASGMVRVEQRSSSWASPVGSGFPRIATGSVGMGAGARVAATIATATIVPASAATPAIFALREEGWDMALA